LSRARTSAEEPLETRLRVVGRKQTIGTVGGSEEPQDGGPTTFSWALLILPPVLLVASGWFMIAAAVWLTRGRDALGTTLTIVGGGLVLIGAFASRASGPVSLGPEGVKFVLGALVPRAAAKAEEKARDLGYTPDEVATASAVAATTAATAPAVLSSLVGPPNTRQSTLLTRWATDRGSWPTPKSGSAEINYFDALADAIATQAVEAINPARPSQPHKPEADTDQTK